MILDYVKNTAHYEKLHPELKTVFEFIQKNDLRSFALENMKSRAMKYLS